MSSSKIRKSLLEGSIKPANEYLGYQYSLSGTVVKGNQRGRTIGFPTANILVDEIRKLIPANGVYAAHAIVKGKRYNGMMNIGNRPTVGGGDITIEVNIFDFNEDIYGERISVNLFDKIRNEQKFESIELLKAQLHQDKETVLSLREKHR